MKKYIFIIVVLALIASTIFVILKERKTSKTPEVNTTPVAVSFPKISENSTASNVQMISDDEAHKIVWNLSEVQKLAEEIRKQGVKPFTRTESDPAPEVKPGTEEASYRIYFGEEHQTHTVRVMTFSVDAYTKEIFLYDLLQNRVSLEEWRKREK